MNYPSTIAALPKAELHCHIEGAAHPELVQRLANKHGLDVSSVIGKDNTYLWNDFTSFLHAYDHASLVFRTPEDYRLLAYDHFSRLSEENCIYAEVFASPDIAVLMGIGYLEMINAIAAGINDARKESGIEGRIIVTGLRHLGPESVEKTADQVAANPHPMVTGFGMAGDERQFETEDFAGAFTIAADAGLGLTCHAGEFAGADNVRETVEHLNVTRIGHGVRAIEDDSLIARLAIEGIVLEACPASNIALEVYPSFEAHPFSQLAAAGLVMTLNSDDPPYFHTTLTREYALAQEYFGCSDDDLLGFTRNAVNAAFVDTATRARLHKRLENYSA